MQGQRENSRNQDTSAKRYADAEKNPLLNIRSRAGHTLTITALGDVQVQNSAYFSSSASGDQVPATAPAGEAGRPHRRLARCWLGGWDRGRLFYVVMVERAVHWPDHLPLD